MQRKLNRARVNLLSLIVNSIIISLVSHHFLAYASEKIILSADRARTVASEICSKAVRELEQIGRGNIADKWRNASLEQSTIEWAYSESKNEIIPKNWIFSVRKGDEIIGLVGTDPYTGKFSWRATTIKSELKKRCKLLFERPINKVANRIRTALGEKQLKDCLLKEVKLVSIHGKDYWVIPRVGREIGDYFALQIDDLNTIATIKKLISQKGISVMVGDSFSPSDSVNRLREAKMKEIGREDILRGVGNGWGTIMIDEVPIYDQGFTVNCWAYSLAMAHQWWSPINLGTGDYQTDKMRSYLGKTTSDMASLDEIHKIMSNWNKLDSSYEDFQATWYGEGGPLQKGSPTWYTDDLKTWIAWESPCVVAINSDGVPEDGADHAIVVTGYDDSSEVVYVNNPWGYADTYSYYSFNNYYWYAWYAKSLFKKWRRGMVAGYPGDFYTIDWYERSLADSDYMYDNEKSKVYNIGMSVDNDNTKGGTDSFGEYYENGFFLYMKSNEGQTDSPVGFGGWGGYGPSPPSYWINFGVGSMSPKQFIGDGYFYLRVGLNTQNKIDLKYWWIAWDEDDRTHFQGSLHPDDQTVTVYDDRSKINGTRVMLKPKLWCIKYLVDWGQEFITVYDDDSSGPSISEPWSIGDIYDSYSGSYRIRNYVTDSSGINTVKFSYKFGSGGWSSWKTYSGKSGNYYWYDIPRSVWINDVGKTVYWQTYALDADSDRNNDGAKRTGGPYTGGHISDDDTTGPTIVDYWDSGDAYPGTYYFKVKLNDSSGILDDTNYPRVYYRWNDPSIDESNYDGYLNADWDGNWYTASKDIGEEKAGQTIYWRCLSYDNDNDGWSGDNSYDWSPTYLGGVITLPPLNHAPTLSWTGETNYTNDGLDPEAGSPGTNFVYRVKYTDQDNDPQASGYPRVHIMEAGSEIDGSPFAMSEVDARDTTYSDGKLYTYTKSGLLQGTDYSYYFEAKDIWNALATGAPTSSHEGPDVLNHAPTLSWTGETNYTNDGLDPEAGSPDTNFVYRVKYTDQDNESPSTGYPKVHIMEGGSEIIGSPFAMSEVDAGDKTYSDGKLYTYTKSGLGPGTDYTYYFEAKDVWDASATGAPLGPIDAPDVGPGPCLEVSTLYFGFGEIPKPASEIRTFTISNSGGGTLSGTITTDRAWISVKPTSFNSNNVTVFVTVYTDMLEVWRTYTGTVTIDSNGGVETINVSVVPTCVKSYPNPYSLSSRKPLTFWGTGVPQATIKIYTLSGELVKTLRETNGEDRIAWDGRNEKGERIVRGIYFFTTKSPKERNTGKFTVVR